LKLIDEILLLRNAIIDARKLGGSMAHGWLHTILLDLSFDIFKEWNVAENFDFSVFLISYDSIQIVYMDFPFPAMNLDNFPLIDLFFVSKLDNVDACLEAVNTVDVGRTRKYLELMILWTETGLVGYLVILQGLATHFRVLE
jgi:hypothetical protein